MATAIRGLLAALLTCRKSGGEVDLASLERNAAFCLDRGARGVVPCGGTGEYFDLSLRQRREMLEALAPMTRGRGLLVAGVGAAHADDSLELAQHAFAHGADAVLLPCPYFYRYRESDLLAFFRHAARDIPGPVLLYNLAGFVTPIPDTVALELLRAEPNIVGIKDSSGRLDLLQAITRDGPASCVRIQGHDARLAESLREGLLDAAISGPAGVIPEAAAALFKLGADSDAFDQVRILFEEFLGHLEQHPYPWALKWAAEARGLGPARLPFPLDPELERSRQRYRTWFGEWLNRLQGCLAERTRAGESGSH